MLRPRFASKQHEVCAFLVYMYSNNLVVTNNSYEYKMKSLDEILEKQFPLCHTFRDVTEDGIIFYDGKAHFAFFISPKQETLLCEYLESHFKIQRELTKDEQVIIESFDTFRQAGLFLLGPLQQVSPVDEKELGKLIQYYHDNVLQRKYVLEASEDCNFRCTYCFNTIHEGTDLRHHTKRNMSFEIAKKSIDYYFDQYVKIFKKLSNEKQKVLLEAVPPTLSWYGGETTLNWNVVVVATEYFKSKPWAESGIDPHSLNFSLNTNMAVMTDDMLNFLVENDYMIFASLDGPKEENDKCRVFPNNEGTYEVVMKNLRKIKKLDPDYFKRKVSILSVEAETHDVQKCRDYFEHWEFPELDVSANEQEKEECVYSNPSLELAEQQKMYASDLKEYKAIIDSANLDNIGKELSTLIKYTHLNFTNPHGSDTLHISLTCPMGIDNNMIGVDGNIHICHKTDGSYPFANIHSTPLDYSKLVKLYKEHNECVNQHCYDCWAIHVCGICGAKRLKNGTFRNPTPQECDVIRGDRHLILSALLYTALKRPELYLQLKKKKEELKDYIPVIDINSF